MPNNTVRADGEAMPAANQMNRRNALAITATGITAALAGLAVKGAEAKAPASELPALIDAHRKAYAAYEAACIRANEIEAANDLPRVKVQLGRELVGKNPDGSNSFAPLYAVTESQIDRVIDNHLAVAQSLRFGPKALEAHERRRQQLKADLAASRAALKAAEDACGLTAANDARDLAFDLEQESLAALIGYSFRNADEIRLAASYLAEQYRADALHYTDLIDFVTALGRAS
ncbi:hypothetical protein ATER59S_05069 [Aquamicrobium terrae]